MRMPDILRYSADTTPLVEITRQRGDTLVEFKLARSVFSTGKFDREELVKIVRTINEVLNDWSMELPGART